MLNNIPDSRVEHNLCVINRDCFYTEKSVKSVSVKIRFDNN